jgi:hypothetical protein
VTGLVLQCLTITLIISCPCECRYICSTFALVIPVSRRHPITLPTFMIDALFLRRISHTYISDANWYQASIDIHQYLLRILLQNPRCGPLSYRDSLAMLNMVDRSKAPNRPLTETTWTGIDHPVGIRHLTKQANPDIAVDQFMYIYVCTVSIIKADSLTSIYPSSCRLSSWLTWYPSTQSVRSKPYNYPIVGVPRDHAKGSS